MRRCSRPFVALLGVMAGLSICATALAAIVPGQIDDFQSASTMGWFHGGNSLIPPTVVNAGGPGGANDAYLKSVSLGSGRPDSRQVVYNVDQWTGDYIQAGITTITAQMADFGPSPLAMRLTIQDDVGTKYSSTTAIPLPADSQWHAMTFDVSPAGWSLVSGTSTIQQSLANVTEMRILSATNKPDYFADTVASTLGIDNIIAIVPEPAMLAPLALAGALVWRRRIP